MGLSWLITGGCGFIGTSLVDSLVREGGHAIRVLDNLSVGTAADLARVCTFTEVDPVGLGKLEADGPVQLVVGDILDQELALRVTEGCDVIVHLAANTGVPASVENPRQDCMANVLGTFNYLEAARVNRIDRFVFASSGAPAGNVTPPIHEELAPHPVSPYGASKLAGEGYCSAYAQTFGVQTVSLRFGNVYGPLSGHKTSVVAKFIGQAMRGETLEVYGDGTQTRDFIYIDDLIRAIRLSASTEGIGGETFQIATNAETTLNELVENLLPILAEHGIQDVRVNYVSPRLGDVRRNFSDTSKARRLLGWQAETSLAEGLRRTVAWFMER
jgi:UDP-glucose 4-epimerase